MTKEVADFKSTVKVMFEDGNEPGIIFQHSLTGREVRSLWITSYGTSGDMQGWKGNCPNLSIILFFFVEIIIVIIIIVFIDPSFPTN